MRSHGVPNFPDPARQRRGSLRKVSYSAFRAVSNSQVEAAQNDCRHLLPAGGSLSGQASQPVTAQDQQDYLKAAGCMRSHGITNFPDPIFSGGNVSFPRCPPGIEPQSTQFNQARRDLPESSSPRGSPTAGQQDDTVDGSRHNANRGQRALPPLGHGRHGAVTFRRIPSAKRAQFPQHATTAPGTSCPRIPAWPRPR